MDILWDNSKNNWLKKNRNISFEHIVIAIDEGKIIDILTHPNQNKYPNQLLILVNINDYVYVVPTEKFDNSFFLKTIFPSRKYTEKYLNKSEGE